MTSAQIWRELHASTSRPVFRRVDEVHPSDIYLGISNKEEPELMLLSSGSSAPLPRFKSIVLSEHARMDSRVALVLTLTNPEFRAIFEFVCDSLIEVLRSPQGEGTAAGRLIAQLVKWRRLLDLRSPALTTPEIHGLMGELLFLERLAATVGATAAIDAWLGPSGSPQDFQSAGRLYEIKTCQPGAHEVAISSLDQLNTGATPLTLIVYFIGSSQPSADTHSLNQHVARVRECFQNTTAAGTFELKLTQTGYDSGQPEADAPLLVLSTRAFSVADQFPRLIPANVASAVAAATYTIDLDQCERFEIPVP